MMKKNNQSLLSGKIASLTLSLEKAQAIISMEKTTRYPTMFVVNVIATIKRMRLISFALASILCNIEFLKINCPTCIFIICTNLYRINNSLPHLAVPHIELCFYLEIRPYWKAPYILLHMN